MLAEIGFFVVIMFVVIIMLIVGNDASGTCAALRRSTAASSRPTRRRDFDALLVVVFVFIIVSRTRLDDFRRFGSSFAIASATATTTAATARTAFATFFLVFARPARRRVIVVRQFGRNRCIFMPIQVEIEIEIASRDGLEIVVFVARIAHGRNLGRFDACLIATATATTAARATTTTSFFFLFAAFARLTLFTRFATWTLALGDDGGALARPNVVFIFAQAQIVATDFGVRDFFFARRNFFRRSFLADQFPQVLRQRRGRGRKEAGFKAALGDRFAAPRLIGHRCWRRYWLGSNFGLGFRFRLGSTQAQGSQHGAPVVFTFGSRRGRLRFGGGFFGADSSGSGSRWLNRRRFDRRCCRGDRASCAFLGNFCA